MRSSANKRQADASAKTISRTLCLLLVIWSGTACSPRPAGINVGTSASDNNDLPRRGHLLIVGGGPTPQEVAQRFVDLAGGRDRARIAVVPMASSVASTGPDKVNDLKSMGAHAFVLNVNRVDADADSVVHILDGATGIWFSGGDQSRLAAALRGSRLEAAIHARYAAGAVIGGTSAGAAVMTSLMLTGDERHRGGTRPSADSTQVNITIDRDNVVTTPGFGLLPGAIIDQHFVRRRRQNRLISLVLENPSLLGVGIDESTALVVRPDGAWEIIGASVALIFDARTSSVTPAGKVLGASEIRMHVLPGGSTFDPASGRVIRLGDGP